MEHVQSLYISQILPDQKQKMCMQGLVIPDRHFAALAFTPLATIPIYGKCTCTPYLQTFQHCTVVSENCCKRAAGAV